MQKEKVENSFLRWAGGKRWLVPELKKIIKNIHFDVYHEPFLGGGSIYFNLLPKRAVLSDLNGELINAFIQVRDRIDTLFPLLMEYCNTQEEYYRVRQNVPVLDIERAARFIFLNQTSFNGLYRVNKEGDYNVPYGFRKNILLSYEKLKKSSENLRNAEIIHCDFEETIKQIKENDLVFLDPPYTVSHNKNGFIEYNQKIFKYKDQERLKGYIDEIDRKNAYYILTNAAHTAISDIFKGNDCKMIIVSRASTIGGLNSKRGMVSEFIFTNIQKGGRNGI